MILVFGKTGQVAKELLAYNDVLAIGRNEADLATPRVCEEAIKRYAPLTVINAAAFTAVDQAESQEGLAKTINGDAPGAMAKVCAALDIPLVHISTDYVFDGTGSKPWLVTDATSPQKSYGKSKLLGEEKIKLSGCTFAILRTSWVVSAHGNNFVKSMRRLCKTTDVLNIVDDQIGGPTCASDIARACITIANQLIDEPQKSGIYHYSGYPDVSWCEFDE